ncbi:glycosyltransferase family 4 protein [Synechococcus elongatus]|uniref:glycosyltransferase family 4 protein n=1 Tax=Synechococcus elongatus TaxID=32046 RepID=UPI000F7F43E1|nr:glycosyltransferase family 1 protein [Synechococcus elongatus]
MGNLLVNLAMVLRQPTGISTYALSLLPYLRSLQPTLLSDRLYEGFDHQLISSRLCSDRGRRARLARLYWTQTQVPKLYRRLGSRLLFSPAPEAPIDRHCRSVVMVHDLRPLQLPSHSWQTYYFRWVVPKIVAQASHVLCNSEATAADLCHFYQLPAQKITPIYLGYDRQHYQPWSGKTSNYFLHIGQQFPHKNLERLIRAFAQLPTDYQLYLAGSRHASETPRLEQLVHSLGLRDRVQFLRYVDYADLPRLIGEAIALVYPSLWEGFGLPILEAMACGTPVITAHGSSLSEVGGEAVLYVDPYRIEAIAAAMRDLIDDSNLRQSLRDRGFQQASRFSWEATGKETCQVLEKFL